MQYGLKTPTLMGLMQYGLKNFISLGKTKAQSQGQSQSQGQIIQGQIIQIESSSRKFYFGIYLKLIKFTRFLAIMFQYDDKIRKIKFVNATVLWVGGLILQIITTLTSAYSTFKILVDRLIINKIKVSNRKILHK